MSTSKREPFLLLIGDLILFAVALWLALAVRWGGVPDGPTLNLHFSAFVPLFFMWAAVFFIAGLYSKHTLVFRSRLSSLLLWAQVANSALGVLFFYLVPFFRITPKIVLALYLVISFGLVLGWRMYVVPALGFRRKQAAILIGNGQEIRELWDEVNGNPRYAFFFILRLDPDADGETVMRKIRSLVEGGVTFIVADLMNKKLEPLFPELYRLIFSNVRFADAHTLYEEIFDRVPLSLLRHTWFVENISASSHVAYDALRRAMDIIFAVGISFLALFFYPLVYCAIRWDDGGSVFIMQDRIGRDGRVIRVLKIRTMKVNDGGLWLKPGDRRVTRVGYFLRKLRIDELPQLWNVIRGDLSLIGPRPDIIDLGSALEAEIPYYTIRTIIKPGLSGWAQIKQDLPPQSIEATKIRLSYDLYYIKNRSFALDLEIALKTIKTLLSRSGM